jgi:hypothetical protein
MHSVETKEIDICATDMAELYQEFGITIPNQAQHSAESAPAKKKEGFVRTLPLPWIVRVFGLRGKALHVGIVLWYFAGLTKSSTVKFTRSRLKRFGIHPETARRALRTLEEARLVSVERRGHASPVVTIVDSL